MAGECVNDVVYATSHPRRPLRELGRLRHVGGDRRTGRSSGGGGGGRFADGVGTLVSDSQNGQIRHTGSIGFEHE